MDIQKGQCHGGAKEEARKEDREEGLIRWIQAAKVVGKHKLNRAGAGINK